ncbi:MAG: hypothetical protein ACXW18_14060 [Pyrinomonadaceae bacterium]
MDADRLFDLFRSYLEQLPSLLTLLACIVFAIIRWRRHPKVSMVVVIALGYLLLHQLIFTIVYQVVPNWFIRSSAGYENIRTVIERVYLVLGLISNSAAAIGYGVLLAGIFMQRKPGPTASAAEARSSITI